MQVKFRIVTLLCLMLLIMNSTTGQTKNSIPHLRAGGNHTQLIVGGKPFLIVGGELHNSSSSAPEYLKAAVRKAKEMNVNTVIASVSWEQFEPREGQFDYSLVDYILKNAEEEKLKVVLIWFATWKNGESSYAPLWVKKDTKKYFRVRNKAGKEMTAISPFCKEAMYADAKAFTALMKYIKVKDVDHTIIMVQVENEAGAFSEMDYSKAALRSYHSQVPRSLINYLVSHKQDLESELKSSWDANGNRTSGTWSQVFGEKDFDAQNFCMSWQYAKYINEICKEGKAVYDLPMYVNAWLVQYPGELPGKYPNGGPVSRVMDIYKAAAPYIDFISPDIYLPDFKDICGLYYRPAKNNPLFIPECGRTSPGKAYYALAEYNALGFSTFGIESLTSDMAYALSYKTLDELLPVISKYQGTKNMRGILKENEEDSTSFEMGNYKVNIDYMGKEAYGVIIKTSPDEFLIAGINLKISFSTASGTEKTYIGEVFEGGFEEGKWQVSRRLNGDETWHNAYLFVNGRSYTAGLQKGKKEIHRVLVVPEPVLHQHLEKDLQIPLIKAPGIYKVKLYQIR